MMMESLISALCQALRCPDRLWVKCSLLTRPCSFCAISAGGSGAISYKLPTSDLNSATNTNPLVASRYDPSSHGTHQTSDSPGPTVTPLRAPERTGKTERNADFADNIL